MAYMLDPVKHLIVQLDLPEPPVPVEEYLQAWENTQQTERGPDFDNFNYGGYHYYIDELCGHRKFPIHPRERFSL